VDHSHLRDRGHRFGRDSLYTQRCARIGAPDNATRHDHTTRFRLRASSQRLHALLRNDRCCPVGYGQPIPVTDVLRRHGVEHPSAWTGNPATDQPAAQRDSRRKPYVPTDLPPTLKSLKALQAEQRVLYAPNAKWNPDNLIFTRPDGTPVSKEGLRPRIQQGL
jgi:hypothetical protein